MFRPSAGLITSLDSVAHIIQVALTPVFLLSAIGTLLNVFATRLARVADRVDLLSQQLETAEAEVGWPPGGICAGRDR